MAGSNFIIDSYPKDGRLAKYEKELANLEKTNDTDGILSFCKNLFCDCMKYLQSKSYHFPDFYFNLINKKEFNELSDRLDRLLGSIPRHRAMIVGGSLGSPPQIYIDLQSHLEGYRPADSIINLCISYLEELIHASSPIKKESEIQDDVCLAIEGFLEIALPDSVRQYRLNYANICDRLKEKK